MITALIARLVLREAAWLPLFQLARPRPLWLAFLAAGVVVTVIVIVSWRLSRPSENGEDDGD
jgi:hypothetical protein